MFSSHKENLFAVNDIFSEGARLLANVVKSPEQRTWIRLAPSITFPSRNIGIDEVARCAQGRGSSRGFRLTPPWSGIPRRCAWGAFSCLEYHNAGSMLSRVKQRGYRYMPIDLIYRHGCATDAAVHSPWNCTCLLADCEKVLVVSDTRGYSRSIPRDVRYCTVQLFIQDSLREALYIIANTADAAPVQADNDN